MLSAVDPDLHVLEPAGCPESPEFGLVGMDVEVEMGWGRSVVRPVIDEALDQGLPFSVEILHIHV